jgi:hypothetical protein
VVDRIFNRQGASQAHQRDRSDLLASSGVFWRFLILILTLSPSVLLACKDAPPPEFSGMDVQSGQRIRLRPGAVAGDRPWQGCYQSPQLGQLALREHANGAISGHYAYQRGACRVVGELSGERAGNLAKFELWEVPIDCPGWERLHGQGFLLYAPAPRPGQPAALLGERSYLRARRVSRDYGVLEPYDPRRVTALRAEPIDGDDACSELPSELAADDTAAGARP